MIFIASFKSYYKLKECCLLAISNGLPKWYEGGRYKKLAPKHSWVMRYKELLNADSIDTKDVDMLVASYYEDVLQKLDPKEVYKELMEISGGNNVVLLSQESSNEFSSRLIVRKWFLNAGIDCEIIADPKRS